ncbi:MAG: tRNA (adenosine(37)-N6)-threonylcarbamoyltransferase complex transferase subunit TsaD, partial [Candidatus Magasanikbacteria bacterium]|nr:tRNA (adenosine(37)-N6)-threonylcarbamoyltransferase complex transferase subunit TsaD [Candidatus Magasanikbacteria bacterium]
MRILAIETSCDDTSVAIVEGRGEKVRTLASVTASQIPIHRRYGGVVPEVAARAHAETIIPVIKEVFAQLGKDPERAMKKPPIDAIAVTAGPGLVTSLWVGVTAAKLLAHEWNVPLYGVNHMVGHLYSSLVDSKLPKFPALGLIVSGGHTELIVIKNVRSWKKIGATRDDAAGEAFDKFAKLLGLPYPGGPEISELAEQ